jgi:hypothetical protein
METKQFWKMLSIIAAILTLLVTVFLLFFAGLVAILKPSQSEFEQDTMNSESSLTPPMLFFLCREGILYGASPSGAGGWNTWPLRHLDEPVVEMEVLFYESESLLACYSDHLVLVGAEGQQDFGTGIIPLPVTIR